MTGLLEKLDSAVPFPEVTRERRRTRLALRIRSIAPGQDPQDQQNNEHHQQQANQAAGAISPLPAIRPRGSRPDEQENQDDEQDETHTTLLFDLSLNVVGGIVIRVSRAGQLNSMRDGKERTSV